mmetsp:Transcript_14422/g.33555  ORF Transcript_14422/g.33555 Transcript_14422/m.33555 type:complete len:243 (+) Transcript_14422:656-1384(+)
MRNFVLRDVIEAIFESPVRQGIAFSKSSSNGCILEKVNPGTLKSLPSCATIDHTVGIQGFESSLERFNFADAIVLFDVFLPQIDTVSFVVGSLVSNRDSFSAENFGLESVEFFDFLEEFHGLREQVEGVNAHDLAFVAVLQVSHAVEQVGDDDVTSNHGIWENCILIVLTRNFQRVHSLFFQVFQTHFLRFSNELFLVKLFGGNRYDAASNSRWSVCRGERSGEISAVNSGGGEKSKFHRDY